MSVCGLIFGGKALGGTLSALTTLSGVNREEYTKAHTVLVLQVAKHPSLLIIL